MSKPTQAEKDVDQESAGWSWLPDLIRCDARMLLYTDTIRGKQIRRDDLWAVSSEELSQWREALVSGMESQRLWLQADKDRARYIRAFRHYHVRSELGDQCKQCRLDLRDAIHIREGEQNA